MKKLSIIILLFAYITASAQRKNLILEDGFESNVGEWYENNMLQSYSASVSDDTKRFGSKSLKVELRKGEGYRAEFGTDPTKALPEIWLGFSAFIPSAFTRDPSEESIMQFQAQPDFNLGETWRSAPLFLGILNDHYVLEIRTDSNAVTLQGNWTFERIDLGLVTKDSWTDYVFHIKWAYNNTGVVEVWKNGELSYSRLNKPNRYNDKLFPYYKTGIYKWDWAGLSNSITTDRLLYIDEVRLGNEKATYCDVSPGTLSKPYITGYINREQWNGIVGTNISDIPLQTKPSSSIQVTAFEGPLNVADNYGSRIRGYISPPQTGNYTFWLATDDAGELWLSTDDNTANKVKIAYIDGWASYREWGKYSSQKSIAIPLQAGKKYYIEALQKEAEGGDNLSVQWQLPDSSMETPIGGSHLSPYNDTTATVIAGLGSITRDEWDNIGGTVLSDIPLQTPPTSTGPITAFEGPLNIKDNYGSRIRGYICPPQTGKYTFWIATDDQGELWLSTNDNPDNKTRIAYIDGWANYWEWDKYSSQQSMAITLQAGKKYYIEALQKEAEGGDNLSVQWQLPDGTMEAPISGSHLLPYLQETISSSSLHTNFVTGGNAQQAITTATKSIRSTAKPSLFFYPNPVSQKTTVAFALPEAGQTSITLYDTQGHMVSKLFNGETEANITSNLVLDVKNLHDGIYIIRLISGKTILTKKIIVMKGV